MLFVSNLFSLEQDFYYLLLCLRIFLCKNNNYLQKNINFAREISISSMLFRKKSPRMFKLCEILIYKTTLLT